MNKIILVLILFFDIANFAKAQADTAIFAGGCFWCMEPPFDAIKGVTQTRAGYAGGNKSNPNYEEVSSGTTGHREVLEVTYDPRMVSYAQLLKVFWLNVDPFDKYGQFCDKGEQYTSAVFTSKAEEKLEFEKTKPKAKGQVHTLLLEAKPFYPAEEYHQDYYKKNPIRYKIYRFNCGRDKRLKEIWEKRR
ncbi:MAG: peptide-methionine (S)-S-oxide reductase [Alphaproteobacteria bacterium]|nr:MAG: peptide-methionine (S)-S-oxide reductase [Alphaproteobacteria bacterium]